MTIGFTLKLEKEGETVEIPLDFTPLDPSEEQMLQMTRLLEGMPVPEEEKRVYVVAALGAFIRLDLPDEDWEVIGPVLIDAIDIEGSTDHIEVLT